MKKYSSKIWIMNKYSLIFVSSIKKITKQQWQEQEMKIKYSQFMKQR